jgi:hypothetical protein
MKIYYKVLYNILYMSLDFFLQMRKMYNSIEIHLTEIIEKYDKLIELTKKDIDVYDNENNRIIDVEYLRNFVNDYNNKQKEVLLCKKYIYDSLLSCCEHEYVTDTIDVDLEYSINIEYCVKCECNKE